MALLRSRKTRRAELRATAVADAVTELLRTEFSLDDHTAEVLHRTVSRHVLRDDPRARFEFILDNPGVANWRLKGAGAELRVADYSYTQTHSEREAQLNARLAEVLV